MKDRLGNEVPEHAVPFARWVAERGWNYLREYIPPWEDEDGWHEGFWSQEIWSEKPPAYPREDGVWFFSLTVSNHIVEHEETWPTFLEFAEQNFEWERISCKVPYYEHPAWGSGWVKA